MKGQMGLLPWVLALALGFVGMAGHPTRAVACAVCGFGAEESRSAFLLTTGLMSLAPLLFIGSVVYVIWRRTRVQETKGVDEGLP